MAIAAPKVTGPGNLFIHASIYAKRRFAVKRYSAGDGALMYVYGSISAGLMTASEPRYSTRVEFDTRLEEQRAPGFPMTDRYSVVSRDAAWTVEPAQTTTID